MYTLNNAKLRRELWQDISLSSFEGEWCLLGDFNIVQSHQDCIGPFAILLGTELTKWNILEEKWCLVDAWKMGPWKDEPDNTYHSL